MSECRHGRSLNQDCYACAETADPREAPGPTEGLSEPKASEEAKLKTVLDREAATIKRYDDKLDEAEAKLRAALAEAERLDTLWVRDIMALDRANVQRDAAESALAAAKAKLEAARVAHFNEAARIASTWCLVPPDGGAPTEAERSMCEDIAARILAFAQSAGASDKEGT